MNLSINAKNSQLFKVLQTLRKILFNVEVSVNINKEGGEEERYTFTLNDMPVADPNENFNLQVPSDRSILALRRYEMERKENQLTPGLILIAIGLALFVTVEVRNFFPEIHALVAFALTLAAFMSLFIGIAVTVAHFIQRKRGQK